MSLNFDYVILLKNLCQKLLKVKIFFIFRKNDVTCKKIMLMTKLYTFLIIVGLTSLINSNIYAQCTPNTSCVDVLNPGEICPEELPDGTVNVPYSETVTIIPPATYDLGSGSVTIKKIKITNVENVPPGLTWTPNPANAEFVVTSPATRGCVLLSGTPTTAGTYNLKIHIVPYVSVGGIPVAGSEVVDDTSLSITINTATGINYNLSKLTALDPQPNPYTSSTRLGFNAPKAGWFELIVFDVLGNKLHEEKKVAQKGENFFEFTGSKLSRGVYFYSIQSGTDKITRQLIKQ